MYDDVTTNKNTRGMSIKQRDCLNNSLLFVCMTNTMLVPFNVLSIWVKTSLQSCFPFIEGMQQINFRQLFWHICHFSVEHQLAQNVPL